MTSLPSDVRVVIVGAGPAGLTAALQLGRANIPTLLLERRGSTSTHPRGHYLNARTMELFRQWGIERQVVDAALPPELSLGFGWVTRIAGEELGRILVTDDPELRREIEEVSPSRVCSCPQDMLEPILLEAALSQASVDIRFGFEVTGVTQTDDGVTVHAAPEGAAQPLEVRGEYVLAADGVQSPIRQSLGITTSGLDAFAEVISVYFRADLTPYTKRRPYILWWVVNADTQGGFIAIDGIDRWTYSFGYDQTQEEIADYPPERCAEIVRKAVGAAGIEIDVRSVLPWQMSLGVAEQYRQGRVLLVGDAAHYFPPTGGYGMNTGIQDAHNLAWKLAAVLEGRAAPALLDTYGVERQPVAQSNGEQSITNSVKLAETLVGDHALIEMIETEAGRPLREQIAAAIPNQVEHFFKSAGQVFGMIYKSTAVVDDGSPVDPSTAGTYAATARPGARIPHMWLRAPDGRELSTLDLTADRFVLMAGEDGEPWCRAMREVGHHRMLDVGAYVVGPNGDLRDDGTWARNFGIERTGALLVRPDGHVGFRASAGSDSPADELGHALDQILGLGAWELAA
jgi:2-polyprenyl-6-methoxyphenol hydroxylase-like FAD-dependent oxidoreductase